MLQLIINVDDPNQAGLLDSFESERIAPQSAFVINGVDVEIFHRPVIASTVATQPWEDDWTTGDFFEFAIGNPGEDNICYTSVTPVAATTGFETTLTINTVAAVAAFAATTANALTYYFSIKRTRTSGEETEYYQRKVVLKRSVVDPDSAIPTPSPQYVLQGPIVTSGLTATAGVLLGRYTASTGNIQQITVGSGLTLNSSTGVLTSAGGGGDVTLAGPNPFTGASNTFGGLQLDATQGLVLPTGDLTGASGYVGTADAGVTLSLGNGTSDISLATGMLTGPWEFTGTAETPIMLLSDIAGSGSTLGSLSIATATDDAQHKFGVFGINMKASASSGHVPVSGTETSGIAYMIEKDWWDPTVAQAVIHEFYITDANSNRPFVGGIAEAQTANVTQSGSTTVTISASSAIIWPKDSDGTVFTNMRFKFTTLGGGSSGVSTGTWYYLLTAPTNTTFTFSDSAGGSAITATLTSGTVATRGNYGQMGMYVPTFVTIGEPGQPGSNYGISTETFFPAFEIKNFISGTYASMRFDDRANGSNGQNIIVFRSNTTEKWRMGTNMGGSDQVFYIWDTGSTGGRTFQIHPGGDFSLGYSAAHTPASALDVDGTVTATAFSGSGASLTSVNAATVTVADAASDTSTFPMLAGSATGTLAALTDAGLSYNASTNALTVTGSVNSAEIIAIANATSINMAGGKLFTSAATESLDWNVLELTGAWTNNSSPIVTDSIMSGGTKAGSFSTLAASGNRTFATSDISTTALATPSAISATQYTAFASTVSGAAIMGYGTTNDVSLMNRAGTVCLGVGPNSTTVNIPASLLVSSQIRLSASVYSTLSSGNWAIANGGSFWFSVTNGGISTAGTLAVTGQSTQGGAAAAATTTTRFTKATAAIADNTATAVLTVTIPNAAHSASLKVRVTGSLGAGGAIGANEATGTIEYNIAIARTAGVNAVVTAATATGTATASVAGAATITVTAAPSAISGAVGATNTFTVNATIAKGSGSSDNHTCVVSADLVNANATGITLS
jgi:hypothetical protein